jgi:DNA repair protein RadC
MAADATEGEEVGLAGALSRAGLELRESAGEEGQAEYLVLGNTYANKDILKDHGGRWSRRRQGWVFTSIERLSELARALPVDSHAGATPGLADAPPAAYAAVERPQHRREKKRYHGHRERLRTRFMDAGPASLPDYELLELLLFFSIDVRDTKDLAKDLLKGFGSLGGVLNADPERLREMPGLMPPSNEYLEWLRYWRSPHHEADREAETRGEELAEDARRLRAYQGSAEWERQGDRYWSWRFTAILLRAVRELAERLGREQVQDRPIIGSWTALLDYLQVALQHEPIEQFRVLFLDRKNILIRDEVQQRGTVDHTPLYPREIVKRALELQASSVIMVHNHPSGDPTPSRADIDMTKQVVQALGAVGISVHDHVIIGKNRHTSFKSQRLI